MTMTVSPSTSDRPVWSATPSKTPLPTTSEVSPSLPPKPSPSGSGTGLLSKDRDIPNREPINPSDYLGDNLGENVETIEPTVGPDVNLRPSMESDSTKSAPASGPPPRKLTETPFEHPQKSRKPKLITPSNADDQRSNNQVQNSNNSKRKGSIAQDNEIDLYKNHYPKETAEAPPMIDDDLQAEGAHLHPSPTKVEEKGIGKTAPSESIPPKSFDGNGTVSVPEEHPSLSPLPSIPSQKEQGERISRLDTPNPVESFLPVDLKGEVSSYPTVIPTPVLDAENDNEASGTPIQIPNTPQEKPFLSSEIEHDIGPNCAIYGTTEVIHKNQIDISHVSNVPKSAFKSSREGMEFDLVFHLEPGTYNIELGFVEVSLCSSGARVFNVHVNGHSRLESYDIFQESGGCAKAIVEKFVDQAVDPLIPEPIVIRFHAISSMAALSFIRIKPSKKQCVPVTSDANLMSDHLAHAVAGEYPPGNAKSYVDRDNIGYARVNIDGSGSHTHFSYHGRSGKIMSYRWTLAETGKVISTRASFQRKFSLGTTRIKLMVIDDACSQGESETSVSVTGNMQPGSYCYYYYDLKDKLLPGTLLGYPRPNVSSIPKSGGFFFSPFSRANSTMVVRCLLSLESHKVSNSTVISIRDDSSGLIRVYEGEELVIDSNTTTESGPMVTSVGLTQFEVIYQQLDKSRTPSMKFMVDGKIANEIWHDQSTVLPIITSITPSSGSGEGGARTKISGFGLYRPLKVHFGSQMVEVPAEGARSKSVFAISPPIGNETAVDLNVETRLGRVSNSVRFKYADNCDDIRFTNHYMKNSSGDNLELSQPTSVRLWQDGKIYMGSRTGFIQVVEYDSETFVTNSLCHSEKLEDSRYRHENGTLSQRTILGITFDPRDTIPRPYASVSTLFWEKRRQIDRSNKRAWSNGAVERFEPSSPDTLLKNPHQCLQYDRNIVRHLPVGDGDHAVNELVFTQDGDLLIAVGGFTNMGLPHGIQTGNWESPFSSSVLIARLSRGASFNGTIQYTTPNNLRTAFPVPNYTDVELYATGVRNLFSMAMARSGNVYALDMGPNCKYGNASSTCSEYNETEALMRSTSKFEPFPGRAIVGPPGECRYNDDRPDKLLEIKQGKFYGHSNLQRAAVTKLFGECAWVDPLTGRVPPPFSHDPPKNYEHPLALVRSPKTGLREYGANLFCGKLRGDLILSQVNSRGVWRAPMSSTGEGEGSPFLFHTKGGLRVEENAHGDLLFPIYGSTGPPGVFVMRPKVKRKSTIFVANAVPFRHGRQGGSRIRVGGWCFSQNARVLIAGQNCEIDEVWETEISCVVPDFQGDSDGAVDVAVEADGGRSVLPKAVLYMFA